MLLKKKNQVRPSASGSGVYSLMMVDFVSPFSLTTGFVKERY